ncbi:hypothetical protein ACFWP3_17070 [Streptomyces sp. NPDC058525]|uniref:hypothetical protein n=1 Tax=Streptomyces sp. NPDC058525 TaxID=3346538 RepID=UPI0036642997
MPSSEIPALPSEADAKKLLEIINDAPLEGGGPKWDKPVALRLAKSLALGIPYDLT